MNKIRIGILTYHRSINYGAVTQCYALVERLKKDFPTADVQVIDYMPEFRERAYKPSIYNAYFRQLSKNKTLGLNLKIFANGLLSLIKNRDVFRIEKDRFSAIRNSLNILPLSPYYDYDDYQKLRSEIGNKYDIIISGSDCVWKWETVPYPNAYYLPGDFSAKKMSYAASFATDDYQRLSEQKQKEIAKAISDFSYVGLRDVAGEYNVSGLCPDVTFFHNCDPTLLLDKNDLIKPRESVLSILKKKGVDITKPMVGVMGNDIVGRIAKNIFGNEVTLIGLYNPCRYTDVFLSELSVLEWASSFGLFSLTFTTFFHGTLLSLINQTPVLTFDYYGNTADKQPSKLYDLYSRLDLMEFYNPGKKEYSQDELNVLAKKARLYIENPPKEIISRAIQKESNNYISFKENLTKIISKIS